ncbi:MAG TPA: hypothetical protein DEP35_21290, partial [Deltaproteobacteria bacterium]|nr:hypothetical protein [Deltaproteobacteria bacterium]
MRSILGAMVAIVVLTATPAVAQQTQPPTQDPWGGCCGVDRWPMGPGMMGPGMMGPGSVARHHQAMMSGIPAPYSSLKNPLPRTPETVQRGAAVYAKSCASCHGVTGRGDGEAGRGLSPPPANLAWLSQMPMAQWD